MWLQLISILQRSITVLNEASLFYCLDLQAVKSYWLDFPNKTHHATFIVSFPDCKPPLYHCAQNHAAYTTMRLFGEFLCLSVSSWDG